MDSFEILEHTADIGFRAWGASPADLFANSARALMAIAADTSAIAAREDRIVEIRGHDWESLLVNWLEEILYLFDSARFAARDFHIHEAAPERLRASLTGEPRDPARHRWKVIVKAITYHGIEVAERDGRWESRVFVDI